MTLWLIRHAHAVDAEEDPRRPLSPKGRSQVGCLVQFFRANGALAPGEFWHSPLARSVETATLLARGLRSSAPLVEIPGLEPEDDPAHIARRLANAAGNLAIVGHEPHLGTLASLLLSDRANPVRVEMKKGSCLALERDGDQWIVTALIGPRLLKA